MKQSNPPTWIQGPSLGKSEIQWLFEELEGIGPTEVHD